MAKVRKKRKPDPVEPPDSDLDSIEEEIEQLYGKIAIVARHYSDLDAQEKKAKAEKERKKKSFNEMATRLIELTRPLAQREVHVTADEIGHGFTLDEWVAREHPGYRVKETHPGDGEADVLLEEDPALQRYHVVVNGVVVGRTTSEDAPQFDAEGFFNDPSDFSSARYGLVQKRIVEVFELDEEKAERVASEHPEALATLQRYTTPGAIKTKMLPVRKATEND